jgi:hypothetical protein
MGGPARLVLEKDALAAVKAADIFSNGSVILFIWSAFYGHFFTEKI